MQSNNKQLIEISRLAQALFHSRVLSHKKELKNTERIKAREWKRILTGKERIESLGGNWSGFKIKLREVRDGGREGKRELRSAFNDDFFLSCSFHILSFWGVFSWRWNARRERICGSFVLLPIEVHRLYLCLALSAPLPPPSAPKHPGSSVPTVSDCQTSPLPCSDLTPTNPPTPLFLLGAIYPLDICRLKEWGTDYRTISTSVFVALDFNIEEDRAVDLMLGAGLSHDVMIEKCKQDFFKKGGTVYYKAARRRVFWTLFKSCTAAGSYAPVKTPLGHPPPKWFTVLCMCKCASVWVCVYETQHRESQVSKLVTVSIQYTVWFQQNQSSFTSKTSSVCQCVHDVYTCIHTCVCMHVYVWLMLQRGGGEKQRHLFSPFDRQTGVCWFSRSWRGREAERGGREAEATGKSWWGKEADTHDGSLTGEDRKCGDRETVG